MIRTLFWKEFREQRLFALLLVGFAGLFVALVPIAAPMLSIQGQNVIAVQQVVLILFALLCGFVSGALHWANERETGTETFLDMMPVSRSALWRTKTVYAITQWALQMVVLGAIALGLYLSDSNDAFEMAVTVFALSALALTLTIATSAWSRTVLGAIGRAIPFGLFVPYAGTLIFVVVTRLLFVNVSLVFADGSRTTFALGTIWTLFVLAVPLWFSYRRITAVDRARGLLADHAASPGQRAFMTAWKLAAHDVRTLAWPAGVLLAATCLLGTQEPNLAWLLLGSLLGAWLGVSVTDAEKEGSAFKLWADQRLPVGTLWSVKLLHRLMLLVCCAAIVVIVAGGMLLKIQISGGQPYRWFAALWTSTLASVTPPWTLMLLGPLFGLGAGLLFALITPKRVISILGAGLAALALTLLWLPMVGSGGIRLWQWLGVPLMLAATARALVWPWAAGRLSSRAALAGLLLPILGIAGYWFGVEFARVAAVPKLTPLIDESAFMSVMRTTQASQAGDRLSEVASEVLSLRNEAVFIPNPIAGMSAGMLERSEVKQAPMGRPSMQVFQEQTRLAMSQGLKAANPQVRKAFEKILDADWVRKIEALAAADVEYANLVSIDTSTGISSGHEKLWLINLAGEMLLIDAIRKDEAGDAAGALARIDQSLRMTRWLRRRLPFQFSMSSESLTSATFQSFDLWRSRRTSKADVELLKQANAMFDRHVARSESEEDRILAEYFYTKTITTDSRNVIESLLSRFDIRIRDESWSSLSSLIWSTAIGTRFEAERRQRLNDYGLAGYLASARTDHQTLYRLSQAHGRALDPGYFFGESYFNHGDWVSPELKNPTPEENQAAWQRYAGLIHRDIYFRYDNTPFLRRTTRDIARRKAIYDMIRLENTLQAHRILHGDWPKSLAELDAPGFGPAPKNPMTGEPFVYAQSPKGVVLKAPDLFPTEVNKSISANGVEIFFSGRRYALEFEIPSFEVK